METLLLYSEYLYGLALVVAGGASYILLKKKKSASQKGSQIETISDTKSGSGSLEPASPQTAEPQKPKSLDQALSNSKATLFGRLQSLFNQSEIKDWEEVEEVLYTSDIGPKTVNDLMEYLQEEDETVDTSKPDSVRQSLKLKLQSILDNVNGIEEKKNHLLGLDTESSHKTTVWMIVGVNGSGKTTTLGKLSNLLGQKGKKVMVAAGDTFRAAADKQLKVWADRAGVEVFSPEGVKDPSAVAYQALEKAKAQDVDYLLVDTAGRLHTQTNLMEELKKMKRVMQKIIPDAPHETIIILDANNGQNALQQAKEFHQALDLSGVIFTKMDGSAKAGVAFGIANELQLPIKRIGIGESLEDLRTFDSKDFVDSIFE